MIVIFFCVKLIQRWLKTNPWNECKFKHLFLNWVPLKTENFAWRHGIYPIKISCPIFPWRTLKKCGQCPLGYFRKFIDGFVLSEVIDWHLEHKLGVFSKACMNCMPFWPYKHVFWSIWAIRPDAMINGVVDHNARFTIQCVSFPFWKMIFQKKKTK